MKTAIGGLLVGVLASAAPPEKIPALPSQYTAMFKTSTGTTTQQYNDATRKQFAIFESSGIFKVADCISKLTYSNAPAIPIPGTPPGVCTLKPPNPYYDDTCPSVYAPTWPPASVDFYAGYGQYLKYNATVDCPATTGKRCDRYNHQYGKNTFQFFVVADTEIPDSGSITYAGVTYDHTFISATVDPAKLGRPDNCPDPSGACAICFTGACAPCQQCVGQPKTGACAACWAPDAATGFSCMADDAAKDLCTECWKPAAPTPGPAPTPGTPDTCGGPCASLGITGQCCPTAKGSWLDCCDHQPACSANPGCAAQGIEGDCCPTSKGVNLACCFGAPTPASQPTPAGDPCQTGPCGPSGECNACKACVSSQVGPCAPCWAKQPDGSACLPDCQDKCWKPSNKVVKAEAGAIKTQIF